MTSPPEIKIHYEQMEGYPAWAREKSQKARAMHGRLSEHMGVLRGRAWIAPAADTFYREIEDTLAGVDRLSNALLKMDETLARIVIGFREAEAAGRAEIKAIPMDDLDEREEGGGKTGGSTEQIHVKAGTSSSTSGHANSKSALGTGYSTTSQGNDPSQQDSGDVPDDNTHYDRLSNQLIADGKRYTVDGSRYSDVVNGWRTAILYEPNSPGAFAESVQAARDAAIEAIMSEAVKRLREQSFGPAVLAAFGFSSVGDAAANIGGSGLGAWDATRAANLAGQTSNVTAGSIVGGAIRGLAISAAVRGVLSAGEILTGASIFGDDQNEVEETIARVAPWIEQQIRSDYAAEIAAIDEVNGVLSTADNLVASSTALVDPDMSVILYQEEGQTYIYIEIADMSNASESVTIPISEDAALMLDQSLMGGQ